MNAFNTFFKSPFKTSKPHFVHENRNHDVDQRNHIYPSDISKLSNENRMLNNRVRHLEDRLRCADEQSSRHRALYEKARTDLLKIEDDCREQVKELQLQLNSIQRILQNISDHECIAMMRKVRQNFDNWINGNFKDGGKINLFLNQGPNWTSDAPSLSIHQKRMSIQAHANAILCKLIFYPYSFILASYLHENNFLMYLEERVYQTCTTSVWQNYRFGMNEALKFHEKGYQTSTINHIVHLIEDELGEYASTEKDIRQSQLSSFVAGCMDLKKKLKQQQCIYRFHGSVPGEHFDVNTMAAVDGASYPEANIELSLWPALLKKSPLGEYLCLESESVVLTVSGKRD